ncbi:MAG: hypothetical protein ACLRWQ_13715 [Flavonifractor plautii]
MGRAVGGRAAALLLAGRTVSRFGSSFLSGRPASLIARAHRESGASGLFFTLTSLPPCWPFPSWGRLWSAPTGKDC